MPIALFLLHRIKLIGLVWASSPYWRSVPQRDDCTGLNRTEKLYARVCFELGFYTLDPRKPTQLILAPFHGKPACQSIAFGRGVCGAAAAEKKIVRVEDVRTFAGHIACDGDSRSEIVVPILVHGQVCMLHRTH